MNKALLIVLLCCHATLFSQTKPTEAKPVKLTCEHLVDPLGMDAAHPRFAWMLRDGRKGARQIAYQIIVDRDSASVVNGRGTTWNTGKRISDSSLVVFNGKELEPFTRYFWKVIIWDIDGKAAAADVAVFETGFSSRGKWRGSWISDHNGIDFRPAPYFRKEFAINKTIKSARAYIAVAGLYELSLNGSRVGDHALDPIYTRFDRRTLYVAHDITAQLKAGKNTVGVVLGNGWYNHQSLAVWNFHNAPWRARPAFCLDIRVVYTDGSEHLISSDLDWKTSTGPIIANSIYTGEQYDARLEQPGWDSAGFNDAGWKSVQYRSAPSAQIVSQLMKPIRRVTEYRPRSVNRLDDSTYVFDMGQNMAGVTQVKLKGPAGTIVQIKHGERLDKNGHVDLSNIDVYFRGDKARDPFQTDVLILSGTKEDVFMPKFNYKGFRYVEVTASEPIQLGKENITAWFSHSDVQPTGVVSTSSKMINDLWRVTNHAYLSNLMGYPTDCPQREKNGWTGDGHLAVETALFNYDAITIYEKWMADHRDEQQPNGVLPDIIPTGGWGYGTANGLDWTSTIAIIPWQVYLFYGDSKLLRDCYENIKRYVDYVAEISPDGLTTFGRGDWVPVKTTSNLELTSSIYFYVDAGILAAAAKIMGKQADHLKYEKLSQKIKDAINAKFLDGATAIYGSGSQTELSMALHWKLVPDTLKQRVAANLNRKVEETNFHLDVGVLGAKALLNALKENGYGQTAYNVAVQDSYPSWGWWVVNGATTLLENWDLNAKRDISDNHMMFGEIGGWFFKSVGGLAPDPDHPGFKNTLLRPIFPDGLDSAEIRHESPFGEIVSRWKKLGKTVRYEAIIPANTKAVFYAPENALHKQIVHLAPGRNSLTILLK